MVPLIFEGACALTWLGLMKYTGTGAPLTQTSTPFRSVGSALESVKSPEPQMRDTSARSDPFTLNQPPGATAPPSTRLSLTDVMTGPLEGAAVPSSSTSAA